MPSAAKRAQFARFSVGTIPALPSGGRRPVSVIPGLTRGPAFLQKLCKGSGTPDQVRGDGYAAGTIMR